VAYGVQSAAGPRDVLFVVERDNSRVSMFALPYCNTFGSIGTPLQEPMGIALHWEGAQLQIWITDIGPSPQRVQVFDVVPGPAGLAGTLRRTFVMPSGTVLESIAIDAFTRTALVSDENARNVMRYDLEGNLLGRFGEGRFTDDPEGIAIYDLGDGTGYVIVTDQVSEPMNFEVFDRQDFRWLTSFHGPTLGTDGVTLVQRPMPNFPQGSFFAVHQDRAVHAYAGPTSPLPRDCVSICPVLQSTPGPNHRPHRSAGRHSRIRSVPDRRYATVWAPVLQSTSRFSTCAAAASRSWSTRLAPRARIRSRGTDADSTGARCPPVPTSCAAVRAASS
jgi:hypothetical protein